MSWCVPLWVYLSWDSQHFGELSNCLLSHIRKDFGTSQVALVVKNQHASAEDARDVGLIPGSRRSHGVRNGNPLQYSCLENSTDRRAWQALVHGAAKSWIWLRDWAYTLGKFSAIISSNTFLGLFLFSFYDLYNANVGALNVDPEVSQTVFISLHFFFFILFCRSDFHHSVFQLTYLFCLTYCAIDSFYYIFHFNYCITHLFVL